MEREARPSSERACRRCAPRIHSADRSGRSGSPDCLRKYCQPALRAQHRSPARNCHPHRARRRARPSAPPALDGKSHPRARWRRRRNFSRRCRCRAIEAARPAKPSTSRRSKCQRRCAGFHLRHHNFHRDTVRPRSRAHSQPSRSHPKSESRRFFRRFALQT